MHTVLYLRGLNTQGDDHLRAGGLAFGPMHRHWAGELSRRGRPVVPVTGFGGGRLAEQVGRAAAFVAALPEWRDPARRFHLLGHSVGGCLARALVHELNAPARFVSAVSLAAPHRGSPLALIARGFPRRHPHLHRLFKRVNYDITERLKSFSDLEPDAMAEFNRRYPDVPGVEYACVIFSLPLKKMGWPVKLASALLDEERRMRDHDGYVESGSQAWGRVLATVELDHLAQIGFDFSLNPAARRRHRRTFLTVADRLEEFWRSLESRAAEPRSGPPGP